jgi:hypothetical protein
MKWTTTSKALMVILFGLFLMITLLGNANAQETAESTPPKIDLGTISERPPVIEDLKEIKYEDKKWYRNGDWYSNTFETTNCIWYPDGSPNENIKTCIGEQQINYHLWIDPFGWFDKDYSIRFTFDVPREYTGSYDINLADKNVLVFKDGKQPDTIKFEISEVYKDTFEVKSNWVMVEVIDEFNNTVDKVQEQTYKVERKEFSDYKETSPEEIIALIKTDKIYNDPDISACGTISSAGVYTLTSNITFTGACITVTAGDVLINGAGFNMTGGNVGSDYPITVNANSNNVTIRDIKLYGYGTGTGIRFTNGSDYFVINNTIGATGSGGNFGVHILNSGVNVLIKDNIIEGNSFQIRIMDTGAGFYTQNLTLDNNNLVNGGAILSSPYGNALFDTIIVKNNIFRNQTSGWAVTTEETNVQFYNNSITDNSYTTVFNFGKVSNSTFYNNYFYNEDPTSTHYMFGFSNGNNISVYDNIFENITSSGSNVITPITFTNINNSLIYNNTYRNLKSTTGAGGHGIVLATSHNNKIYNETFINMNGNAIGIGTGGNNEVYNINSSLFGGAFLLRYTTGAINSYAHDLEIRNTTTTGVYVTSSNNITINNINISGTSIGINLLASGGVGGNYTVTNIDIANTTARSFYVQSSPTGVYVENLTIDKGVTAQLDISGNDQTYKNIYLTNAITTGLQDTSGSNKTFTNIYINNQTTGFYSIGSNSTVTNITITNSRGNPLIFGANSVNNIVDGFTIINNTGSSNMIHLNGANINNNTIKNGYVEKSVAGYYCINIVAVTVTNNIFNNITCSKTNGLVASAGVGNRFTNLIANDNTNYIGTTTATSSNEWFENITSNNFSSGSNYVVSSAGDDIYFKNILVQGGGTYAYLIGASTGFSNVTFDNITAITPPAVTYLRNLGTANRTTIIDTYVAGYTLTNPGSQLTIKERNNAEVYFYINVNASGVAQANLSNDIKIGYNYVSINATRLNYNDGLNITFYDIPEVENATILKNGLICTSCYNYTPLYGTEVIFNDTISGLNNYSIQGVPDADIPQLRFITPPTPTNNTNLLTNTFTANITCTDMNKINASLYLYNQTGLFQQNDTSGTARLDLQINYTIPYGTYYLNATCFDTSGNRNNTDTRVITYSADAQNPQIQFVNPTPTSGTRSKTTSLTINVTASDDISLTNVTIRLYNSINDLINTTNSTTSPLTLIHSGLAEGIYYFNATAIDSSDKVNNTATWNYTVDLTAPTITINTPVNGGLISGSSFVLDTSYSETISSSWYNLNGNNVTFTTPATVPLNTTGTYTIRVWANDTANNIGYANSTFQFIYIPSPTPTPTTTGCIKNPWGYDDLTIPAIRPTYC